MTSSQFDLCIELSKKIVKRKTRTKLSNPMTRAVHRNPARVPSSSFRSPELIWQGVNVRDTSMNTGDSHHRILWRAKCARFDSSFVGDRAQFRSDQRTQIFFSSTTQFGHAGDDSSAVSVVQCNHESMHSRNRRQETRTPGFSHLIMCKTAPLIASCQAWAIIPGRRLLRHHASKPNISP